MSILSTCTFLLAQDVNIIKNNRSKFIKQNFESVHSQTYPNIEHIIIAENLSKKDACNMEIKLIE